MARSICKLFSNVSLTIAALVTLATAGSVIDCRSARAEVSLSSLEATHYTETSWLSQYNDIVVTSELKLDLLRAGPLHGYGGAVLEQDSRSTNGTIYNDNGVSPMVGAWMPLIIPQIALFTEYRQTFRVINKPDSRAGSQPDLLMGSYGYQYWALAPIASSGSLFQEMYGEFISRSKLSFNPVLESWSKTGYRYNLQHGLAADAFLDIEFRRASTGEAEDNFQTLGPGLRLTYFAQKFSASLGTHQEIGAYTNRSDSISRWKTLFVISGAF